MALRLVVAVLLGVLAFLVSSLAHQFARGFDDGVLASGAGIAVAVVGGWWVWVVGAIVLVLAFVAVVRLHRVKGIAWLAFGVTVAVLAVVGALTRVAVGPASESELPVAPLVWLIDGASAPLTWAVAGVALGIAWVVRRRAGASSAGT